MFLKIDRFSFPFLCNKDLMVFDAFQSLILSFIFLYFLSLSSSSFHIFLCFLSSSSSYLQQFSWISVDLGLQTTYCMMPIDEDNSRWQVGLRRTVLTYLLFYDADGR
ncbi:hypothetical protein Droror1_Dr00015761 [Drosera rotundifolia]